ADGGERRGLAGAVGTDEPGKAAQRRVERQVVDGDVAAETDGHPLDLESRHVDTLSSVRRARTGVRASRSCARPARTEPMRTVPATTTATVATPKMSAWWATKASGRYAGATARAAAATTADGTRARPATARMTR